MAPIIPLGLACCLLMASFVFVQNRHHKFKHSNHDNANGRRQSTSQNMSSSIASSSRATNSLNSALAQARQIQPPAVTLTKGGEYEHGEFWGDHDAILKMAWKEWFDQSRHNLPDLMNDPTARMDSALVQAIDQVRQDPTEEKEAKLKELFQSVLRQQVYKIPWFTKEGVRQLRQHLDAASYYFNRDNTNNTTATLVAGIPTRRPNGMNRYGIIIDPTIEGAVSYQGINQYLEHLVKDFVRPIAHMLFPEMTSRHYSDEDDAEAYAFTIRYHPDQDMQLKEHSDASLYTININLNLQDDHDDQFEGSSLYFVEPTVVPSSLADNDHDNDAIQIQEQHTNISFAPGMAVVHRGIVRHAALPITNGERHNLVIWLFGKHGYVRTAEYPKTEQLTVQERWQERTRAQGSLLFKSAIQTDL